MDKFKNPFIVGGYKLNLSNLEQLAKALALKSNLSPSNHKWAKPMK
jgi:hypothetical protein